MAGFNMQDQVDQDRIRKGNHSYALRQATGTYGYVDAGQYQHQEYPKMMLTKPAPKLADFKNASKSHDERLQMFQDAMADWNQEVNASIVKNKEEEKAWVKAHSQAAA